ncbi:MAG: dirigent protein [Chloroflexota bacterium]|nr:dirigent protein [Chloroflexota bacterium]
MAMGFHKARRRSILKSGALMLAGAMGLSGVGKETVGQAATVDGGGSTVLTLYGRQWQIYAADRRPGTVPVKGDRVAMYGEFLDDVGGRKVGEFYATCFCVDSPFGANPFSAANVEMHTLNLEGGTIIGMGSASAGENHYAIVGGTGRFLGARGSYVAQQHPWELGGDGTAEFVITLMA